MTTKKKNIIAVVIVLLIWGYVGLKMMDYFKADGEAYVSSIPQDNMLESLFKKDTFNLYLNYEDPFLRSRPKVKKTYSSTGGGLSHNRKKLPPKPIDKPKPWPEVKFNGLMQSSKSKEPLGLLNVGTRSYLIRTGDFVSGVKVISFTNNEIQLDFNGEIKAFSK